MQKTKRRYIGLIITVIALLGANLGLVLRANASEFPINGSIVETASISIFNAKIGISDLASLSPDMPFGILGFMTAGDLVISLLLFAVIMLLLLMLFFKKI